MTEVWLHANRRVLLLAMIPAGGLALVGALLLASADALPMRGIAWGLVAAGAVLVVGLANQLRQPRIAFKDGQVLFNLRPGAPVAVPVDVVEAFFLGQGPAHLSPLGGKPAETVNLVARLSEKAPEWARMTVKPALGAWCEGYVTIRGAWCEPLRGEVIRRLNRRLREIRDAAMADRSAAQAHSPAESAP